MQHEQVAALFREWINQKPGLDPRDYIRDWRDENGRRAYRSDANCIARDRRRALQALYIFEALPFDEAALNEALRYSFMGRLSLKDNRLHYCTGQYWPTEYRIAAAVVLENYNNAVRRQQQEVA